MARREPGWQGTFLLDVPHPDLCARRVIVAAYCYYVLDESIMPDSEYDWLSQHVADHWDELDPDRQWALDTPEQTRASGYHIFFSSLAVSAAYQLLRERGIEPSHPYPTKWKWSKHHNCRYVTAARS